MILDWFNGFSEAKFCQILRINLPDLCSQVYDNLDDDEKIIDLENAKKRMKDFREKVNKDLCNTYLYQYINITSRRYEPPQQSGIVWLLYSGIPLPPLGAL